MAFNFRWEFLSEDYDVGFGIYRRTIDSRQKASEMIEVLKTERANSQLVPEDGLLECEEVGTCKFVYQILLAFHP